MNKSTKTLTYPAEKSPCLYGQGLQSVEKGAKSGIAKQFHRAHFFENNVAIIIHFWDAFFLEKRVPNPCKLGTIAKQ